MEGVEVYQTRARYYGIRKTQQYFDDRGGASSLHSTGRYSHCIELKSLSCLSSFDTLNFGWP